MKYSFSVALVNLKGGGRVAREGWNGKGMWLVLHQPSDRDWAQAAHPDLKLLPYIAMKTADGGFVPWLASQTDLIAEDWAVLP